MQGGKETWKKRGQLKTDKKARRPSDKEARRQQKEQLKRQTATRRKVSKGMEKKMQGDTMKVSLLRSMIDCEKESNYGHS